MIVHNVYTYYISRLVLLQLQVITFKRYTLYIRQTIRLMYMKTFKIKTERK